MIRVEALGRAHEALALDLPETFAEAGASGGLCPALGVRDDCLTHADFRDRNGVTIGLLSDTEGDVCRKYGVLQHKQSEDGVRRECLVRSTFVIDKKGVIRHAEYGVNPRGHAAEVFDVVKRLRS